MFLIQIRARTAVGYGHNSTAVIVQLRVGKLTLLSKSYLNKFLVNIQYTSSGQNVYVVNYCALLASL